MLSNKELGHYLNTIREKLGYSTRDVNKLCKISQSYISLMENGKRKASPIVLKKLSSIYHLDYRDLYKKAGYEYLLEESKNNSLKTDEFGNSVVPLPLVGTVKAGYDYLAEENWEGIVYVKSEFVENGAEYFTLKVKRR